jgi:hypothetical protein
MTDAPRVGNTYTSNDSRSKGKVFTATAVEGEEVTLNDGSRNRTVTTEKLEKNYSLESQARLKPGRPARQINTGSTWKRRSDDAVAEVVAVDQDAGTITLKGVKSGKETVSKLLFFRRRFEHVKG